MACNSQAGLELIKLHHALPVLFGWYLMMPPFSQWLHYQEVAGYTIAELSDWDKFQSFETKQDCETMMRALRYTFDKGRPNPIQNRSQYDSRLARCVASDDPRLKAK
jgi:hypothetical protein